MLPMEGADQGGPHPGPDELFALEEAARLAAHQAYQAQMQQNTVGVPQQVLLHQGLSDPQNNVVSNAAVDTEQTDLVDELLLQGNEQILQQLTADDATRQQLLNVLEQQRQRNDAAATAERARQMRPEKHYFTISQDGAYPILFPLGFFSHFRKCRRHDIGSHRNGDRLSS